VDDFDQKDCIAVGVSSTSLPLPFGDDLDGPASSLFDPDPHFPNPSPTAKGESMVAAEATERACS
jgi:hypothetical protein